MSTPHCNRRVFLRTATLAGMGMGMAGGGSADTPGAGAAGELKVGIIGLDTSHATAFTKALNTADASSPFSGCRVVAAYPHGSLDIKSSVDRIPAYTQEVQKYGVEIVGSIDALLAKVDAVLLETNDGRRHLEQSRLVFQAGKRVFIDKPISASLADAVAIFDAARKTGTPVFSSSSLRYITGAREIRAGRIGRVLGAETYSPAPIEQTHPDLFWYGIHGVETLFAVMGTGCRRVVRVSTDGADVVVGAWADGRLGTFRGIRSGKSGYGGIVFGESGIEVLGEYAGYDPLLREIVTFFRTGIPPVREEETLEIVAFMEAAQESKLKGGAAIDLGAALEKARA